MVRAALRCVSLLIVGILCLGQVFSPGAAAQDDNAEINVEIIVDASGSMAGETDTGDLRMDPAKRVLNEVVQAIPETEGVNVGLRVYGHEGDNTDEGKAESCAASDLVVPIDGVQTDELLAQIAAFEPTGWTPLGMSLEEASADLEAVAVEGATNAIILLTDGIETCEGDPAGAAADALESDAEIVTNVIDFATEPEDEANLSDIAAAGGGQLLNANNAGQLISALFTVLEELEVVEEGGNGKTRDSPIGFGRTGRVGNYEITVTSVQPNATDVVLNESRLNDPPAEGRQFFIARVAVVYTGQLAIVPAPDPYFYAVGNSDTVYDFTIDTCGVISDDMLEPDDPSGLESAESNVCWSVDSDDADSLVMAVESNSSDEPVWFSLDASVTSRDGSTSTDDNVADTPRGLREERSSAAETPTPASNGTTEPADDTSDSERGADGADRDSPVAVGETAQVGDYEVTVISVTPNATDVVMTENKLNKPPAEGEQFLWYESQ